MSAQIEHPEHQLGPQNTHILDTLTEGYNAAMELAGKGFTVLAVTARDSHAVVEIQRCAACRFLRGLPLAERTTPQGRERKMAVTIRGARVQWSEFYER